MKRYILKREISPKMLEEKGFTFSSGPAGLFAVRALNKSQPEKAVVIQLEDGEKELKWRYQAANGSNIEDEIQDIFYFFHIVTPKVYKYTKPSWNDNENRIELKMNELAMEIHKNAVEHGWWNEHRTLGDIIALIHSELSEAFEEFRNGKDYVYYVEGKPEGIAVELIDAVIRIFDFLAYQGVDIYELMIKKHEYNKTRPYKHGGKKV